MGIRIVIYKITGSVSKGMEISQKNMFSGKGEGRMIATIHQPDYIPYLGYFYKMAKADIFVYLEDAQFSSSNMHHWNKVKTPQGILRLKVPVQYHFGDTINQVVTKDELLWKEKHLNYLEMNYARARYFDEIYPVFREMLLSQYQNLAEMNMTINSYVGERFGIKPTIIKSSELSVTLAREDRVIELCKRTGADEYFSGNGAKEYQVEDHFAQRGIRLCYTDYHSIRYPQLWGEFLPDLSVMDYILNCGFDWEYIETEIARRKEENHYHEDHDKCE